jgi:adenosylhomocysteine nucleosidase
LNGIGLVVALPREVPTGFVRVASRGRLKPRAFAVYRSAPWAGQHVAVQSGVGRIRAAEAAHLLIGRFAPVALASFGFAGGLTPDLTPGALVIGTAVVDEEESGKWTAANRHLVEQFHAAAEAEELPVRQGILVTSRHIVANPSAKAELSVRSGACAVDMETAGMVEVADQAGLPWVAVRAIVDGVEEPLPTACLAMLREDGSIASGRLIQACCRSPKLLWYMLRLARQVATAQRHLSQAFARWTKNPAVQSDQALG